MNKDPSAVTPKSSTSGQCRSYVHPKCGGITRVGGHEFLVLADPFSFVTKTLCADCQEYQELDQVTWTDTDEKISSYRSRVRSELSLISRMWAYAIGPFVGACIGGIIGACWPPHRVPEIVAGVIGGGIVGWLVLQIPARKYLGMDFRDRI